MGRRLSETGSTIRSFFFITQINSTCKICGKCIPGFHTGNLSRHIARKHADIEIKDDFACGKVESFECEKGESPSESSSSHLVVHITKNEQGDFVTEEVMAEDEYDEITLEPVEKKPKLLHYKRELAAIDEIPAKEQPQPRHRKPHNKSKPSASRPALMSLVQPIMDSDSLLQHYMNLVLVDGLPIDFLDGKTGHGFFSQLNTSVGLDVGTPQLCDVIENRARELKEAFSEELSTRPVSLVLDVDNKEHTCGVIVQFISTKIERRLLGYLDIAKRESTTDLLADILQLCSSFGIFHNMIYSVMVMDESEEPLDIPFPSSIFRLKCLAGVFRDAITAALSSWKTLIDTALKSTKLASTRTLEYLVQELNSVCEKKVKAIGLDAEDWNILTSIAACLTSSLETYDKLTDEVTCPVVTDIVAVVFKYWIRLGKQNDPVAHDFAKSIKARFCNLLSTWGPVNAAIFLDPRIQQLLSSADKTAAKTHITKVHVAWSCEEEEEVKKDPQQSFSHTSEDEDDEDDLTAFLKEKTKSGQSAAQTSKIERLLQDFTDVPLVSAKTDVLSYWEKDERDGTLRELSQTILAIPAVHRGCVDRQQIRRVKSNKAYTAIELMEDILFLGGNHLLSE